MNNVSNLKFEVMGARLIKTGENFLTKKGQHFLTAEFEFSEEWEGLLKTAIFRRGDFEIDIDVNENKCEIPWEITSEAGRVTLVVIGTGKDGRVAVTNEVGFKVASVGDMYMIKDYVQTV